MELHPVLQKGDVWACGILLYIILTGCCPFQRPSDTRLGRRDRMLALLQVGDWGEALQLDLPAITVRLHHAQHQSVFCFGDALLRG